MKQLKMINAMAELDSVCIDRIENDVLYQLGEYGCMKPYNPITDLALNCAARDKYKAEVSYDYNMITCCLDDGEMSKAVHFKSVKSIPYRVIECILKSVGKWE